MYNVADVDLFSVLETDVNNFQNIGIVFLAADLNACTGTRRDNIICDRYFDSMDDDEYSPDVHSNRLSMDNGRNSHGLKLLDLCKAKSFRIANGRLSDNIDCFTYVSTTGSSVIDYLVLHEHDFHYIHSFSIGSFVNGPIMLHYFTVLDITHRRRNLIMTRHSSG